MKPKKKKRKKNKNLNFQDSKTPAFCRGFLLALEMTIY